MMEERFHVTGMTCGHCVRAVTQAVQALDPAARVTVELETGLVSVATTTPRSRVMTAIESEGYTIVAG